MKTCRTSHRRFRLASTLTAATLVTLAGVAKGQTGLGEAMNEYRDLGRSRQPAGRTSGQPAGQPLRDPTEIPNLDQKVAVDDNLIVDLHVNDEDLATVLQMLSIQAQKNIVVSNNVAATVKADLYGVTFYEALDAILHVNGFGYIEQGNFIHVYTLDEIKKIIEQSRQKVSKTIRLDYLSAVDAAEFVKPLLSGDGEIKTNGKTGTYEVSNGPAGADDFASTATMFVVDYPENIEAVEAAIKELDTRPAQILIEATIIQASLTEANAWGIDFALIGSMNFGDFVNVGGPLSATNALIGGSTGSGQSGGGGGGGNNNNNSGTPLPADGKANALTITPGNTAGPATIKFGLVSGDVAFFIRALDQVTDTTIISRPTLVTLNRQPARVLVGRKVGYLSTTQSQSGSTTQSVEFLDTGTQLHVRPFVSNNGLIRMELKPQVSEAALRTITDAGGAAVTIPDEITNELTANVMVRDGQTIVLGGLFRESTEASRRQVPFLGDLPIIGAAFRGHDDSTARNEIIFLIKPTVVSDATLESYGQASLQTGERVRSGSREGLLVWSRERQVSLLLLQADRLIAEGDTDRALHKVDRALRLSPFSVDAIAMRERLVSNPRVWPDRGMLRDILESEAAKGAVRSPGEWAPSDPWNSARINRPESVELMNEPPATPSPRAARPSNTNNNTNNNANKPVNVEPGPAPAEIAEVDDDRQASAAGNNSAGNSSSTGNRVSGNSGTTSRTGASAAANPPASRTLVASVDAPEEFASASSGASNTQAQPANTSDASQATRRTARSGAPVRRENDAAPSSVNVDLAEPVGLTANAAPAASPTNSTNRASGSASNTTSTPAKPAGPTFVSVDLSDAPAGSPASANSSNSSAAASSSAVASPPAAPPAGNFVQARSARFHPFFSFFGIFAPDVPGNSAITSVPVDD